MCRLRKYLCSQAHDLSKKGLSIIDSTAHNWRNMYKSDSFGTVDIALSKGCQASAVALVVAETILCAARMVACLFVSASQGSCASHNPSSTQHCLSHHNSNSRSISCYDSSCGSVSRSSSSSVSIPRTSCSNGNRRSIAAVAAHATQAVSRKQPGQDHLQMLQRAVSLQQRLTTRRSVTSR